MKLSLMTLGAAAIVGLALFACADSDADGAAPNETPDGSSLPPTTDAGTSDVAQDAAPDADVVVPPKTCSDSALCHLVLPAKQTLVSVWSDGTGTAWAVTTQGSVLKLEANANAWKVHATGLGALVAIWGSGPTDLWVAGEKGILHSAGAEFTASTLPFASPTKITSLWGTAANDVWATGDTEDADGGGPLNVVLRFDGTSWTKVTVPKGNTYYRVWGHAASGVWLAGSRPLPPPDDYVIETVVYRRAPGKTTFAQVTLPTANQFPDQPFLDKMRETRSASAPDATTMWIHAVSIASYQAVIRGTSADNGATFTWTYDQKGLNAGIEINATATPGGNDGWAIGEWGQVKRWDGTAWKPQAVTTTNLPVIKELNAIWASSDRAFIVGDDIAIAWRKP